MLSNEAENVHFETFCQPQYLSATLPTIAVIRIVY